MKTHIVASAVLAGLIGLGTAAFANTTPAVQSAPVMVAQSDATVCDPAKDKAVPLAIVVRSSGVVPAVNPQDLAGASMRGSCVGTPQFVKSSQPWIIQKHMLYIWDLGADAPFSVGASTPPNNYNF
jgi:hypothetical protein